MTEESPLRCRMIEDMTVRNLSPAAQRSYVHAVAKFRHFFGRSPAKLDLEDVRAFQVHLVAGGMSWPALNQTVCALRFLYGVTLGRADLPERIAHARAPQKLSVVLGIDEVVRLLEAVPSSGDLIQFSRDGEGTGMMGELPVRQESLFYGFSLEDHIPEDHLLRSIDRFVEFKIRHGRFRDSDLLRKLFGASLRRPLPCTRSS